MVVTQLMAGGLGVFLRVAASFNKGGQVDIPPRYSFVRNSTSLKSLRPAAYRRRNIQKT